MKLKIFISSVQKEFADERRLLADYIRKDALLGVFFDVFLFEEVEACEYHPDNVDFKVIIWRNPVRLGPVGTQSGLSQGSVGAQSEIYYGSHSKRKLSRLAGGCRLWTEGFGGCAWRVKSYGIFWTDAC